MKLFASRRLALILVALLSSSTFAAPRKPPAKPPAPTITIALDATEAPRKILHARLTIPATAGTLTLYYPKWIPGEHGPTGPIENLAGLKFTAGGQELKWRRDLQDGWTLHVQVPAGVNSVDVSLDFLSPTGSGAGGIYTAAASATDKLAVISWNTVLLYPAGWSSDELKYQASVRLPQGWKFGTPLDIASNSGGEIRFNPVSLTTLVDSPIIAGEYLRVVPLADYPLSDHVAHFGLEHYESNDSRVDERSLVDDTKRQLAAGLLSHEYVHSWNGKYRRPADLATSDYEKPMQTDLLWVYEGLTSYLGDVLSARSSLRTPEEFRDTVALLAARLD